MRDTLGAQSVGVGLAQPSSAQGGSFCLLRHHPQEEAILASRERSSVVERSLLLAARGPLSLSFLVCKREDILPALQNCCEECPELCWTYGSSLYWGQGEASSLKRMGPVCPRCSLVSHLKAFCLPGRPKYKKFRDFCFSHTN